MEHSEQMRKRILDLIGEAKEQRLRPIEVKKTLEEKFQYSMFSVQKALKEMVSNGDLVFTYRDPCNYVEIPIDPKGERSIHEI
jgi:bacterioferritin (cytochrome b1)